MKYLGRFLGCKWYWASQRFEKPGLYVWAFGQNRRLIAVPKRAA